MADLETIKILIRSLIISSPRPLTVEDLRRDYKKSEGEDCPFVALGHQNWFSFLRSLSDTVQILSNGVCKPVSTQETKHIEQLVALQKKSRSRKPPYRNYPPPRFSARPSSSYSYGSERNSYSSRNCYKPKVTDKEMDDFFELSREVKMKKRMEDLRLEQQKRSSSPDEMSAPIEKKGISGPDFLRQWQEHHPSLEVNTAKSNIITRPGDTNDGYNSDDSTDSFCDRFEYMRPSSESHVRNEYENEGCSTHVQNGLKDVCDNSNSRYEESPSNEISDTLETENSSRVPDANFDHFTQSSCKVGVGLKRNLRKIIQDHPDGVWACVLPELYYNEFGVSLDWVEIGYNSICQMAHDLPDIFICKRIKSGDWRLFDCQRPLPTAYIEEGSVSQGPIVPPSVRKRIGVLAKEFPSGKRADLFSQRYCQKYGITFLSEVPDFKDIESLLLSLQDSVIHLRYVLRECYVYPGVDDVDSDTSTISLDKDMIRELGFFPEEVLGSEDKYPSAILPNDLKNGSYIELQVGEVYNPHRFWFSFRDTSTKLDNLMDELQDFYHEHGEKYKMPESTVRREQCCAALYSSEWHRAIVQSVEGALAEVFYVDYGTLLKVPKDELRFMHRDFALLPKQAVRASLFGIQPPGGRKKFSKEASQAFLKLVQNRHLVGLVYKVDFETPSLQLFLIDTSGKNDLHLNDVLVNEKHAEFMAELLEAVENSPDKDNESGFGGTQSLPSVEQGKQQAVYSPKSNEVPPTVEVNTDYSQQSLNAQGYNGNPSAYFPPPGFQKGSQAQMGPQPGVFGYGYAPNAVRPSNNSMNPLAYNMNSVAMNPSLTAAALSSAYMPQVSNAYLQQQQAMFMAFYQNQIRNSYANMLNAQQTPANLASAPVMPHSWLGHPITYSLPQQGTPPPPPTPSRQSTVPNLSMKTEACVPNLTSPSDCEKDSDMSSASKVNSVDTDVSKSSPATVPLVTDTKTKKKKKKKAEKLSSSATGSTHISPDQELTSISSENSNKQTKVHSKLAASKAITSDESVTKTGQEITINNKPNVSICKPFIRNALNTYSQTCDQQLPNKLEILGSDDKLVDNWEDLADRSLQDNNEPSSSIVVSHTPCPPLPELAESLSNMRVSDSPQYQGKTPNFWEEINVCGKSFYLIIVEKKGFISTNEWAKQCTPFSSYESVVRVLDHKGFIIPFKVLNRRENLPLFSALDGLPDDVIQRLGLSRNKNGNIMNTFHLTPVTDIPRLLVVLGQLDEDLIREFRKLRDRF